MGSHPQDTHPPRRFRRIFIAQPWTWRSFFARKHPPMRDRPDSPTGPVLAPPVRQRKIAGSVFIASPDLTDCFARQRPFHSATSSDVTMSMELPEILTKPPCGLPFLYIHVGLAQFGENIRSASINAELASADDGRFLPTPTDCFIKKPDFQDPARRFWHYRRKSGIDGLRGGFPVHARCA